MRNLFWLIGWGIAQSPQVLRFIPGVYRENPYHQIDLYNPYPFAVEVGEWLVVTRDYSVRLPRGLVLRPYQRFRLGKLQGDLVLERYPDFLIRFPDGAQAGAYVALVDRDGRFRGGLYLAPLPQVPFLPDSGVNIPRTGQRIPFYLPSETASLWQYVPWEPDPVTGVVWIEGKWRYTVADAEKEARLYAPLRFLSLLGAAEGEAVHLVWEVEGRDRCESYRIERWEGHKGWQPLAAFPCPLRGLERREYYDPGVRAEGVYRYRLVYEGGPALRVESLPVEVRWQRKVSSFRMVAKPGLVRLWVAQSQPIKVQLLDAAFAEQVRLYDGWVNGGVENIFIWDTTRVREGCWVVVWTPQRRYWEPLCVR